MKTFKNFNSKWRAFVKKNIINEYNDNYPQEPLYGDWNQWDDYYMNKERERQSTAIIALSFICIAVFIIVVFTLYKMFDLIYFYMVQ